jgi:peptide-methionine (S)-S-oxide reductase
VRLRAVTGESMSVQQRETATLGGGCFWCLEAVFKRTEGVVEVTSGYAGGATPQPSYEQVCTGSTGHAEVVQVVFDPSVIDFADVLRKFFSAHDPTTMNRQGADVGTQYRSIILYESAEQQKTAQAVVEEVGTSLSKPVVTEIEPLKVFYPAEEYHQDYFDKNPTAGYCRVVIAPKLDKLGIPKAPIL